MNPERRAEIELEALRALMAALEAEGVDSDDGLVLDMIEGETGLLEALDQIVDQIDAAEGLLAAIKAREAIYKKRRAAMMARIDRLRALTEQALVIAELDKVQRPAATLYLMRVAPKLVVEDESRVPARFFRQPAPVIDRTQLTAALKDGETVEGARLTQGGFALGIQR